MTLIHLRRAHDEAAGSFAYALDSAQVGAVFPGSRTRPHSHSAADGQSALVLLRDGATVRLAVAAADLVSQLTAAGWTGSEHWIDRSSVGASTDDQAPGYAFGIVRGVIASDATVAGTNPGVGIVRRSVRVGQARTLVEVEPAEVIR